MKKINKYLSLAACTAIFLLAFACQNSTSQKPCITQARMRKLLNKDWLFARFGAMPDGSQKTEPAGLEKSCADDSVWRKLDIPHDWGIEGPFQEELPNATGKLPWAGIGWYRKYFTVPETDNGKRFFIDFDGVMSHAKVWLNGNYLGQWPYGYSSFRFELTSDVKFGQDNILAVRLENPPDSSRWYPGGGIYRNVWLVQTNPVHIAHWGVFVTTPQISSDKAVIEIETEIQNQSQKSAKLKVQTDIYYLGPGAKWPKNKVASSKSVAVKIKPEKIGKCLMQAEVSSPELWDIESPNLYCALIIVKQADKVIDTYETVFGIRTAVFDVNEGFLLNGKKVSLKGVCNHHDLGPLGTAINARAIERQIELLQEMGSNAIRTSHNPPAPELLELCDRMGILVIDELFDCWTEGKTQNDYHTLFADWYEKDARALVRRDRNHPCVIMYSSGNEVKEQKNENGAAIAKKLQTIFHGEDPTRPVTAGCDNLEAGFNGFEQGLDVVGYNYKAKENGYMTFRSKNKYTPVYGSETASCVSSRGEYFFPVSDDKSSGFCPFQVSSYDLSAPSWGYRPDTEFEAQDKYPFLAGEFVWTGFDYLGEPIPYIKDGYYMINFQDGREREKFKNKLEEFAVRIPSRSSYFGIFDLCGFRKDRFYLYQSRWRPELPMAHILPHWNWPERAGLVTPVQVYSSADEAELFLNDMSLGRKTRQKFEYRFRWDDVKYKHGELKVVTYKNGQYWAEDIVKTTGTAFKISLATDRDVIKADGQDLSFVTVRIEDSNSLVVPRADNPVKFDIEGPGRIAAVGNGDATSNEPFEAKQHRVFNGLCLVIIRSLETQKGTIKLKADSQGLTGDDITITAE